jgi:hypothetical protein
MNTRAIIVLTVLLVFGWAGAALAEPQCPAPMPGTSLFTVNDNTELTSAASLSNATICIRANLTLSSEVTFSGDNIFIVGADLNPSTSGQQRPVITGVAGGIFAFTGNGVQLGLTGAAAPNGAQRWGLSLRAAAGGSARAIRIAGTANNVVINDIDIFGRFTTAAIDVEPTAAPSPTRTIRIGGPRGASVNVNQGNSIVLNFDTAAANGPGIRVQGDPLTETNVTISGNDIILCATAGGAVTPASTGVSVTCTDAATSPNGIFLGVNANNGTVGDANNNFVTCTAADAPVRGCPAPPAFFAANSGNKITGAFTVGINIAGSSNVVRGNYIDPPLIGISLANTAKGNDVRGNLVFADGTGSRGIEVLGPFPVTDSIDVPT